MLQFVNLTCSAIDDNPDHCKNTTLLMFGLVKNAARSRNRHSLHLLAMGIMSRGEYYQQTLLWLCVVERMVRREGLNLSVEGIWMLDGSSGLPARL
jgi:hypothetical protein